jgi:hypothetical protein
MTHRALPWLLPLALLACGDDSGPGGAETSTGSASTGSESSTGMTQATLSTSSESDSTSSSSGSSEDSSSTSTGEPSTGGPSTGEPSSSGETDSSSSSSGSDSGEPETSSSSGALVCDIVDVVEAAAVGKREPVDCGFVHLADPLVAWDATHDCVVENFDSDSAFTAVAELQGIDSEVFLGYAGSVGEEYVASQFFSDSFGGAVTISGTTPCEIGVVAGCVVSVGDLCLECVAPPAPVTICP